MTAGGFIYIIANDAERGTYKIGKTERTVEERLAEHNNASNVVGHWFEVYAVRVSNNLGMLEQRIHKRNLGDRVPGRREQYRGSLEAPAWTIRELAFEMCDEVLDERINPHTILRHLEPLDQIRRGREAQERAKREAAEREREERDARERRKWEAVEREQQERRKREAAVRAQVERAEWQRQQRERREREMGEARKAQERAALQEQLDREAPERIRRSRRPWNRGKVTLKSAVKNLITWSLVLARNSVMWAGTWKRSA
jgi:hypothetical protein